MTKLKKGDRVVTNEYKNISIPGEPGPGENVVETHPSWLVQGVHNISEVRHTMAGVMVRTDRMGKQWVNSNWFRLEPK